MSGAWKRALDLSLAVPGLILASPVILGLAGLVKLTSPGPAFFVQERVGRHRRPIRVAKLRTMRDGAAASGPHVTAAGDPRVTRLGALLRATKLDELPQLWNVVRGDMSLVGPRPEAPRYVERYRPEWERIFSVRPGLTDPASLAFRDEESLLGQVRDREQAYLDVVVPAKIAMAMEGIDRASPLHDLGVLVRTALAVLHLDREHPAVNEVRRRLGA